MHSATLTQARHIYDIATPTQRRHFCWLLALNIFMGFFEMGVAGSISLLGVAMASPHSLLQMPLLPWLADMLPFAPTVAQSLRMLLLVMCFVAVATVCKNLMLAFLTWQQYRFSFGLGWHVGGRLFRACLGAPWLWHTQQNTADLLTIIGWRNQVVFFCQAILILLTQGSIAFFLFMGALIANPFFSGLLFVMVGVLAYTIHRFAKNRLIYFSQALMQYDLHSSRVAMQGLQGLRECIIYDQKEQFLKSFVKYIPPYITKGAMRQLFSPLPQWVLESAGMCLLLLVLAGLIAADTGVARTTGLLMLLAAISWRLLPAANKSIDAVMLLRSNRTNVEKFFATLRAAENDAATVTTRGILPFTKDIMLEHISFTYPGAKQVALDDVSLRIKKGEMVGIVGSSGSGKSTLVGLLTGLLTPKRGNLTIDGQPWDIARQRLKLGYVPQTLYLLDASIAENVAFSHWGEPIDEERVKECCRMAAMDFIDNLPDGMHTVLGERGVRLSGGQVQRVGIARALYDMPDILIFDEATSSLDSATEAEIQKTVVGLKTQVTLVMIAHRLSTVRECDRVVWIDGGVVRKEGDAESVLDSYAEYWGEKDLQ